MGLKELIAITAQVQIHKIDSMELIASMDMQRFLKIARKKNATLLGLEGFLLFEDKIIPDMGAIADFSEVIDNGKMENYSSALQFLLLLKNKNLFFDVVFEHE
jgi:hypothetical protein